MRNTQKQENSVKQMMMMRTTTGMKKKKLRISLGGNPLIVALWFGDRSLILLPSFSPSLSLPFCWNPDICIELGFWWMFFGVLWFVLCYFGLVLHRKRFKLSMPYQLKGTRFEWFIFMDCFVDLGWSVPFIRVNLMITGFELVENLFTKYCTWTALSYVKISVIISLK